MPQGQGTAELGLLAARPAHRSFHLEAEGICRPEATQLGSLTTSFLSPKAWQDLATTINRWLLEEKPVSAELKDWLDLWNHQVEPCRQTPATASPPPGKKESTAHREGVHQVPAELLREEPPDPAATHQLGQLG